MWKPYAIPNHFNIQRKKEWSHIVNLIIISHLYDFISSMFELFKLIGEY